MKKVEAPTLEEAYQKASQMLECSISELQYEVVQYPSGGILGFLKKNAIIIASRKNTVSKMPQREKEEMVYVPSREESVASEIIATVKEEEQNTEHTTVGAPIDTKLEKDPVQFRTDREDQAKL